MNWVKLHPRSTVLVLITILLPLYIYLSILLGLVGIRSEGVQDIERIEPRLGRLLGLLQSEDTLAESAGKAEQSIAGLVYGSSDNAESVAANLQTSVRQILTDGGLAVVNSQVLPPAQRSAFEHVGLRLTARGSLAGLDAALAEIAAFRPMLLIEMVEARPTRTANRRNATEAESAQTLDITLQVFSLRAAQ
ncbi:MAG: type II secretion system protein GspM [Halioglobus sp.]